MNSVRAKLTVFFEDPFWVGLYERECDGKYEVCKVIFGGEPKDQEIYLLFLSDFRRLRFSPPIETALPDDRHKNPKRIQREVRKALQNTGTGTKAQQALKLQQQQGKVQRKTRTKDQREAEKEHQFLLRQEKHKERHRGH